MRYDPLMVDHVDQLSAALQVLPRRFDEVHGWADALHRTFEAGGKVLVAGNGGSAALASHLTGELVGRYLSERSPLPAIWLGADQAALTAIMNDYGPEQVFARQVGAFARDGDVMMLFSTSGRSVNILRAADAAARRGAEVWSLTGPEPNPLSSISDRCIAVDGRTPTVQEVHQVVVHLLCDALDRARRPMVVVR